MGINTGEPNLDLWKESVCKGDVPPLQPGERMTVGQVRHPSLHHAFAQEFAKWFLDTKKLAKQWQTQKLKNTAVPELLKVLSCPLKKKANFRNMLGKALGWDKVTCQQLKDMLETCPQPEQALNLLLKNSRRQPSIARMRAPQAAAAAAAAAAAQELQDGSDWESSSDDEDWAPLVAADDDWEQRHAWFALPRDLPVQGVRAGVVPETDQREKLRGQHGIWATKDLPEGYLLGPYRHYCLYTRAYEAIRRKPPASWKGTPSSWWLNLESYACNDAQAEVLKVQKDEDSNEVYVGKYTLVFSGWGYGNVTAYANDPHLDPLSNIGQDDMPDEYLGPLVTGPDGEELPGCVQILCATICGWVYVFMCTTAAVKKGQELLYDYGYSYWTIVADAIQGCIKDKKLQELARKHEEVLNRLRATTQATSGLTTSLHDPCSSMQQDSVMQQQQQPSRTSGDSGGASCVADQAGKQAGTAAGVHAPGSMSLGVSDMRQQMGGLQLRQGGSAGGVRDSRGPVGDAAQQQMQNRQHMQDQQPAESVAGAAVSVGGGGAAEGSGQSSKEDEDDACSAVPQSVVAYRHLDLGPQKLKRLQKQREQIQNQQRLTEAQDDEGKLQQVQRVDDPDVVKLIKDVQMKLSEELLKYPNGIKFKNLKTTWWYNMLDKYFHGKWGFVQRHSQLFTLSQQHFTNNTRVELTPEWREALVAQMKAEGRLPPEGVGGQYQQMSRNKRRRGEITITKVIRDEAAEQECAELKGRLKEKEGELQQLQQSLQSLQLSARQTEQDVQQLLQLCGTAGVRVPQDLLQRHAGAAVGQDSRGGQLEQAGMQQQQQQQWDRSSQERGRCSAFVHGSGIHRSRSRSRSNDRKQQQQQHSWENGRGVGGSRDRLQQRDEHIRQGKPAAADMFDFQDAPVFAGCDSAAQTDSDSRSVSPVPEPDGPDDVGDSEEEVGQVGRRGQPHGGGTQGPPGAGSTQQGAKGAGAWGGRVGGGPHTPYYNSQKGGGGRGQGGGSRGRGRGSASAAGSAAGRGRGRQQGQLYGTPDTAAAGGGSSWGYGQQGAGRGQQELHGGRGPHGYGGRQTGAHGSMQQQQQQGYRGGAGGPGSYPSQAGRGASGGRHSVGFSPSGGRSWQ